MKITSIMASAVQMRSNVFGMNASTMACSIRSTFQFTTGVRNYGSFNYRNNVLAQTVRMTSRTMLSQRAMESVFTKIEIFSPSTIKYARFASTNSTPVSSSTIEGQKTNQTPSQSTKATTFDKEFGVPERATSKIVGYWYLSVAALVFLIVVVGGVTRLTESGLSITEWKLITGIKKPSSDEEWVREFEEYKKYPEFKKLKPDMTLEEFKKIYFFEWLHRNIGRFIGLAVVIPGVVFASRGMLSPQYAKRTAVIAGLVGSQGILGWYMVKTGLDQDLMSGNAIPRVNHKFLAAHLITALTIYYMLIRGGLRILKFHGNTARLSTLTRDYLGKRMLKGMTSGTAHMVLTTAVVGGLVAGLDAGQIYNQWPRMGDGYIPSDIIETGSEAMSFLRNFVDNPVTVQFEHRCLGYATFTMACLMYAAMISRRKVIPRPVFLAGNIAMACVLTQVMLGITTLVHGAHLHAAATHQAGSLVTLTSLLYLGSLF